MCCKKEGGKDIKLVVKDASGWQKEIENPFSDLWQLPDKLEIGNTVRGIVDRREYKIVAIIQS